MILILKVWSVLLKSSVINLFLVSLYFKDVSVDLESWEYDKFAGLIFSFYIKGQTNKYYFRIIE